MAKATKQTKKFAASGKLKDTIKQRRQHQQIKRKTEDRTARRAKQRGAPRDIDVGGHRDDGDEEDDEEEEEDRRSLRKLGGERGGKAGGVAKTVDELFGEGGLDEGLVEGSDLEDLSDEDEDEDEDDDEEDEAEEGGLELNEEQMKKAMKDLEKRDPEFFKYLKENDKGLLEFGAEASVSGGKKGKGKQEEEMSVDGEEEEEEAVEEEEDEEMEERKKISVTPKMLRQWQEGMLKQHSLRSLRKTLIAFRAAAHMNEEDAEQGSGSDTKYSIDSAQVFNKLVITALKFTPVVLAHHLPFRAQANGRIKLQPPKTSNPTLPRLVLSHFTTLLHLIKTLPSTPSSLTNTTDESGGLLLTAVNESTKLLPWIMGSKKHVRAYLKVLLELWSTANDSVRIASFLGIRKVFEGGDDVVKELCLKNMYKSLLPPLRNTSVHTLPQINLSKNTASELFLLSPQLSYQQAFTSIRNLAVHLRTVVRSSTSQPSSSAPLTSGGNGKEKEKDGSEAFRRVYNWQFVHALDFWCLVLGGAADRGVEREKGESPLKVLIYPLVQIALGVIRLLPSSRYFPLRFHILHSLIRLVSQTGVYIPLSPFLLELLDSSEFRRSAAKKTTLKPIDLEYTIRAPAAYPKTRIYQEILGEEIVYLLAEYHSSLSLNIAFPEIVLPVIITLKKHLKKGTAGGAKTTSQVKVLIDKLEAQRSWTEGKRRNVTFAPRDRSELERFCEGVEVHSTPLGGWMRLLKKVRDGKRREVEKALREERD